MVVIALALITYYIQFAYDCLTEYLSSPSLRAGILGQNFGSAMKLQEIYTETRSLLCSEISKHPDLVNQLQIRLIDLGLLAPPVDGIYGQHTASALNNFLRSFNLPTDRLDRTSAKKLIETKSLPLAQIATPQTVAEILQCPLTDAQTYFPKVLAALSKRNLTSKLVLVAIIATVGVETGGFCPISEYGGNAYFTAMYENRSDLGNVEPGDGSRFRGRGFVQITGRANYAYYGRRLGIDLENYPDLALNDAIAAEILVQYFVDRGVDQAALRQDWYGVRRLVNGGYNGIDEFLRLVDRATARLGI